MKSLLKLRKRIKRGAVITLTTALIGCGAPLISSFPEVRDFDNDGIEDMLVWRKMDSYRGGMLNNFLVRYELMFAKGTLDRTFLSPRGTGIEVILESSIAGGYSRSPVLRSCDYDEDGNRDIYFWKKIGSHREFFSVFDDYVLVRAKGDGYGRFEEYIDSDMIQKIRR